MALLDLQYYNTYVGSFSVRMQYNSLTFYKAPRNTENNIITTMYQEQLDALYEQHRVRNLRFAEYDIDGTHERVYPNEAGHGAGYFHWDGSEYWIYVLPYFVKNVSRAWVRANEINATNTYMWHGIKQNIVKFNLKDQNKDLTAEAYREWEAKQEMYEKWQREQEAENKTGKKTETAKSTKGTKSTEDLKIKKNTVATSQPTKNTTTHPIAEPSNKKSLLRWVLLGVSIYKKL